MNKLVLAAIRCSLLFLVPSVTYAISAQWDLDPISGDWNTAANWTPNGVPNGPADTATFGLSHTSDVSISANTAVNGITFTSAATNPYTITASPGLTLTISGVGITNNSGMTQNFVTAVDAAGNQGAILFTNSATAGSGNTFTNKGAVGNLVNGGFTAFSGTSSAGSSTFINSGSANPESGGGETTFSGGSTAANGTVVNNPGTASQGGSAAGGGRTFFVDTSSAGNATIINNGVAVSGAQAGFTVFGGTSTAGSATITNNSATVSGIFGSQGGGTVFGDTATAGNATINNNGSTVVGQFPGVGTTEFSHTSSAGSAIINNNSGTFGGTTLFDGTFGPPTAGNATINNNGATVAGERGGVTRFFSLLFFPGHAAPTAGNSTLIANGGTNGGEGGAIFFENNSKGGTARVEIFGNGSLDISGHRLNPGLTLGSIEGDGNVFLGANNLTVGSNNLNTTFSGVMQNGGSFGGSGGSLTKIGSSTLVLSGANTYTGNTNVRGGLLQLDGSTTSNTYVNAGGTLTGTGTIYGNYNQVSFARLLISIAGTSAGQSILDVTGTANLVGAYDLLNPVLLNGFVPTVGDSFTFLNYASLSGTFFISDANSDNLSAHWEVTYGPSSAILTVAPGNVPIIPLPDQGSTCVLLTLGLLGLVTYRRQLLRGQP